MSNPANDDYFGPLYAFWVGPEEVYAATTADGALHLANSEYGLNFFTPQEVCLCTEADLDRQACAPSGIMLGTLRQQLAIIGRPGCLYPCLGQD